MIETQLIQGFIPRALIEHLNQQEDGGGYALPTENLERAKQEALEAHDGPFAKLLMLLLCGLLEDTEDYRGKAIPPEKFAEANFALGAWKVGQVIEHCAFGVPALS